MERPRTKATDELSIVTEGWPTNPLGWLVALCSRRLREGLTMRFVNAGYRVSPEQWSILGHLWRQDGLPQHVLGDRFHRSKVAAFQLINKLEKQGLVMRRPNPEDGRSNLIYLTPKGRAIESELIPLAQKNLVQAVEGISETDLATTKSVLSRIIANMKG
jgi:DNA-binding MarR family transcriptional regulator